MGKLCGVALIKCPKFIQPLAAVQHNDSRVRPLPTSKKGLNHNWALGCCLRALVNLNIARKGAAKSAKKHKEKTPAKGTIFFS